MRLHITMKKRGGDWKAKSLDFSKGKCVFGRAVRCGLQVDDAHCSKRHALLFIGKDGKLYLRDLKSTNGTFQDGRAVQETHIPFGGEFVVGDTVIAVVKISSGVEHTYEVVHSWPEKFLAMPSRLGRSNAQK